MTPGVGCGRALGRAAAPLALSSAAVVLGLVLIASACSSGGGNPSGSGATTSAVGGGGSSPSQTSTGNPGGQASGDPCALITDAEAAALLGASSTQRTGPTQKNRLVDCKWDDGQGGFLLVTLAQGAEFYGPDITNPGWKPVSGLGDMAFEDDATQIVGFIQGTSVVTLYVAFHDTAMADIVTEAKLAAGRL